MKRIVATIIALLALVATAQGGEMPLDSVVVQAPAEGKHPVDTLLRWRAEANAEVGHGDFAPFWLTNGRYGLSSIRNNSGYLRAGIFRDAEYDRKFSWSAGVDLVGAYHFTSEFVIQQLYAGVRYRSLDLVVGAKEQRSQMVDDRLSSGDLMLSNNARPIPQVRISIDEYRYLPFTRNLLAGRFYFSLGMMTDQDWQRTFTLPFGTMRNKQTLYHSKGVMLRLGNTDRFPLTLEGGLEMAAQWGGKIFLPDGRVLDPGHGFSDLLKAIVPMSSSSDDPSLAGDVANCAGNHTGQWNFALAWTPAKSDWSARLYYQHFFEDHSQLFFNHLWRDMLLGFEAKLPGNPFVDKFVYEYLITKDQSGPVYNDTNASIPEQVSGTDNYYNNTVYGAWQHWGMALGNPLLLSPIYNRDGLISFKHNRIKAHHFGLSGTPTSELSWRLLFSYTRSWGTYHLPTPTVAHSCSGLLELDYRPSALKGWSGRLSLGADAGNYLGNNYGAMISIVKEGLIFGK